jgi:3-methyladenine DNA glycosylase AlkC
MPDLFKNLYNEKFYLTLSTHLAKCLDDFDEHKFMALMLYENFEQLELKERMSHTKEVIHQFMPQAFSSAAKVLIKLIESLTDSGIKEGSVEYMFIPEYVETYGINHYQCSVDAFEIITQFTSAEFAVRPFLIKYSEQMLAQMFLWSTHSNYLVRRLASEGCRPRLPWAMALKTYKKDAAPLIPILQSLFNDPIEIVRRSVANNLNDIAKDNPDQVINFAKQYLPYSNKANDKATETQNKTIKHACRTLLKQANPEVLALFGYDSCDIELADFTIITSSVNMGEAAEFTFSLKNNSMQDKKVRLEYGLYFMKKNGLLSKKVFKISERILAAGELHKVKRKQSFKPISTRVYYSGVHQVSIILNGKEFAPKSFDLRGASDHS